ncbi:MAG TPA: metal ABC transporter permease [Vicinamibacterales bacterium]|nr:metal ABC transporter permease [Vicinamibacterales bacterium]
MTTDALLLSIAMAVAAGLVGCFAVMRRMALAADALSHVALPGIGVALALQIHPLVGAIAMLFFGALLVWALEERTRAATETVIGVVFSAALAVGTLMTSGEELIDALFGGPGVLSVPEAVFGAAAAITIVVFIITHRNSLIVTLVSPDVARTAGINVRRLNLLYLEMFALTIALGLRYLGVLLMGALIIIPAATAKRLATNLNGMLCVAVGVAVVATTIGTWLASVLQRETGPLIVSVAAGAFLVSLFAGTSDHAHPEERHETFDRFTASYPARRLDQDQMSKSGAPSGVAHSLARLQSPPSHAES